jgi:hypothetical protein
MGVLKKYDQIELIYLTQSAVTCIYLHPVYRIVSQETCSVTSKFPSIHFYRNVFVNSFPSNWSNSHNIDDDTDSGNVTELLPDYMA